MLRLMMTINDHIIITNKKHIFKHLDTAHVSQIIQNAFCIIPEWIGRQNLGKKEN